MKNLTQLASPVLAWLVKHLPGLTTLNSPRMVICATLMVAMVIFIAWVLFWIGSGAFLGWIFFMVCAGILWTVSPVDK